jgi:hypothetical protein
MFADGNDPVQAFKRMIDTSTPSGLNFKNRFILFSIPGWQGHHEPLMIFIKMAK